MSGPIIKDLEVEATSAPMILILGQSGSGKSHFINRLVGEQLAKESAHLTSCTQKPALYDVKVDRNEFLLVDTPGFNDTWRDSKRSDAKILQEIARTLTLQTEMNVRLRGILYLYDISASRMTGDTLRQLEIVKRIVGSKNFPNVMLVTTHWPTNVEEQNARGYAIREADLRREFWKDLVRGGSRMWRFDDESSTAKAIVRTLSGKQDITLALQEEMAGGKELATTTAGSFVLSARKTDEQRLQRLKYKSMELIDDPSNDDLLKEIGRLQESIEIRKDEEVKLQDDIVERIRKDIETIDKEARQRRKKPTAANIISWLIGVSALTVGVLQTVFNVND